MKWCIPNQGPVVLILDRSPAKLDMLEAPEAAEKAGQLRGDLARFKDLLASHIELEAALAREAA